MMKSSTLFIAFAFLLLSNSASATSIHVEGEIAVPVATHKFRVHLTCLPDMAYPDGHVGYVTMVYGGEVGTPGYEWYEWVVNHTMYTSGYPTGVEGTVEWVVLDSNGDPIGDYEPCPYTASISITVNYN